MAVKMNKVGRVTVPKNPMNLDIMEYYYLVSYVTRVQTEFAKVPHRRQPKGRSLNPKMSDRDRLNHYLSKARYRNNYKRK